MYNIEKRPSGYILTFAGKIESEEMRNWHLDSERKLKTEDSTSFGVIIDMKDMQQLSTDTTGIMVSGQKLYKEKGMLRSAVILNNTALTNQFKNLAVQSGIFVTERYIDASKVSDPTEVAIAWVKDSVDPDQVVNIAA